MDKTAKNVLATVGAISVATSAPLLAAGIVIGVAAANPEKTKKTMQNLAGRAGEMFARAVDYREENECECCHGGKCDCDDEFEEDEVHIPCEELEPESWEEDVPVAEEEPIPAEKAEEKKPSREKLERFFQALLDLAE